MLSVHVKAAKVAACLTGGAARAQQPRSVYTGGRGRMFRPFRPLNSGGVVSLCSWGLAVVVLALRRGGGGGSLPLVHTSDLNAFAGHGFGNARRCFGCRDWSRPEVCTCVTWVWKRDASAGSAGQEVVLGCSCRTK